MFVISADLSGPPVSTGASTYSLIMLALASVGLGVLVLKRKAIGGLLG